MRGDFEAYLNNEFRDESGKLDLNELIISIHSGPNNCHPNRIGTVASWVPETPIIMDHMGFPDDLDAAISVAKANKNISLGTTILRFYRRWGTDPNTVVPTEVKTAVDTLGPERIVFGSNLPEYRPIQVINALKRLELGDDAEALTSVIILPAFMV